MSGVFKGIKKVFKKVVKVVKKIAVPALIVGAIVLTGGAAIGALPAMGTMLGSIGITGGLASALGGAISSAAVGGVLGGLTGGYKGFVKGGITGALTGGLMGAAGMISANGVLADMGIGAASSMKSTATSGLLSKATTPFSGTSALKDAGGGLANVVSNASPFASVTPAWSSVPGPIAEAAAGSMSNAAASAASFGAKAAAEATALSAVPSAAPPGSGLFNPSSFFGNQGILGSALAGVGAGMGKSAEAKAQAAREQAERDYYTSNYMGGSRDKKGQVIPSQTQQGLLGAYAQNQSPLPFSAPPAQYGYASAGRFDYDPTTRKIVYVPVQPMAA